MTRDLTTDAKMIALLPGDKGLLCTDGLTGMVSDADIAELLSTSTDPASACRALVDAANAAGGRDNVTVLVVHTGDS